MAYRVLSSGDAFWRPSNQMKVENTDLAKQLEAETLGARFWRLAPGQASTKHRHFETHELYVLIDGQGRVRVDDEVLTLRPLDALLVEPEHVRQLFNDTDSDALWLVVGSPREGCLQHAGDDRGAARRDVPRRPEGDAAGAGRRAVRGLNPAILFEACETRSGFGIFEIMSSVEMPRKYVPPPLELVKSRIEELLPPDAKAEIDGGAVVVDVRDPERFEAGHVEGAVNVPSGESARDAHEAAYVEAIEKAGASTGDRVILVCGEGNRSARTADALQNEHDFDNVASVIGGSKLWSELGYPIEGEIAIGDEEAETHLEGEEDTT